MTNFLDGPAVGKSLLLGRSPIYLRVVAGPEGIDALDQLYDKPAMNEVVYAYKMVGQASRCHLLFGGKRKKESGWYAVATYQFIKDQPSEDILLINEAWAGWCEAQADKQS